METLKTNLYKLYFKYKLQYGGEYVAKAFGVQDDDPAAPDFDHTKNEVIINIFFLINIFIECDHSEADSELLQQFNDIEELVHDLKPEYNFLRDNFLTQVGVLGYDILKSGASYISAKIRPKKSRRATEMESNTLRFETEEDKRRIFQEAYKFFQRNSAHIEIVRGEILEKVYFFQQPHCHYLKKELKRDFHDNVRRVSQKSKVTDLLTAAPELIEKMEIEYKLKMWFRRNHFKLFKDISFFLAIMINIFVLYSFRRDGGPRLFQEFNAGISEEATARLFEILGTIHVSCTSFYVIMLLIKSCPFYTKKAWKIGAMSEDQEAEMQLPVKKSGCLLWCKRFCYAVYYIISDSMIFYHLLYLFFSVLGLFVDAFFYAFHLFDVLVRYELLRNAVLAVWKPKVQIILTIVLLIILVYTFSLVAFFFFHDDFNIVNPTTQKEEELCDSVLLCFVATMDISFKADGGVG
eukprot:CAMPEP_0115003954 /NCGR_PEP_ID=MMETSP0216-20121206/18921_1 /TAXON_ID=223996 /ORGANISM="Protocruzia adherens, Strain Boccale" /LENGTH=463 /DNA_ID=CAMNT_0002369863 /DNA_START=1584 /DNA_END=2971 /DNA_ORIENTATION=-